MSPLHAMNAFSGRLRAERASVSTTTSGRTSTAMTMKIKRPPSQSCPAIPPTSMVRPEREEDRDLREAGKAHGEAVDLSGVGQARVAEQQSGDEDGREPRSAGQ